jgi:hypothetical protein
MMRGLVIRWVSIETGYAEGKRSWWVGRASNPVGGAMRRRVGSTPIPFRPFCSLTAGFGAVDP